MIFNRPVLKLRHIALVFLILFLVACGKDNVSKGQDAGDIPGKEDSISKNEVRLSQAILLDPVKINNKISDPKIMDSLIHYFNHTPKGAEVYVSIFLFSYEPLIEAMKDAYSRGVIVNIAIDNGRDESIKENRETILQLLSMFRAPSQVVTIQSDASSTAINHNKYVLFSAINMPNGTARKVVFSSSHNFILAGTKKIQDALVLSNEKLYDVFKDNWKEVASRAKTGMKNFTYREVDLDSLKAYFFPRRVNGSWDGLDTHLEILDKISDHSTANVRVLMSDWSRVEVAEKLTALQKKGVFVEVIAKDKSEDAVLEELDRLKAAGGYVKVIKMNEKNNHSKVTLIKGNWDGKPQQLVFTGSHNFTYNALRNNNEVLLMLKNDKLFKEYDAYFDELKKVL